MQVPKKTPNVDFHPDTRLPGVYRDILITSSTMKPSANFRKWFLLKKMCSGEIAMKSPKNEQYDRKKNAFDFVRPRLEP